MSPDDNEVFDVGPAPAPVGPETRTPPWSVWMMGVLSVATLGVVVYFGGVFWREWEELKKSERKIALSEPVGYENISPLISYAQRPPRWQYRDGDSTRIWSKWDHNQHYWFVFPTADLDGVNLEYVYNGSNVIRPIEEPILERIGGARWRKVPEISRVYGLDLDGEAHCYPKLVLDKVFIVQDLIQGRLVLVLQNPFDKDEATAVAAYNPIVDGQSARFGMSGYHASRRPVLFDDQTDSFWMPEEAGLRAIAGPRKGTILPRLATLEPQNWEDWRRGHPEGQLVVGARRLFQMVSSYSDRPSRKAGANLTGE